MAEKLTARLIGGAGGTVTKVTDIVMKVDSWHGGAGMWSQIVEVAEASPFSKIDLQPNTEQLLALQKSQTAMSAENADGIITVYAFGEKPREDMTLQATVTEIVRTAASQNNVTCGSTVGWVTSVLYPESV